MAIGEVQGMINAAIGLRILECICCAVGLVVAEPGYPSAPTHSPARMPGKEPLLWELVVLGRGPRGSDHHIETSYPPPSHPWPLW